MRWFEKIGLLLSQAINTFAFSGDPDESMSARAWREQRTAWIRRIDRVLGNDHCKAVHLAQLQRALARVSVKA